MVITIIHNSWSMSEMKHNYIVLFYVILFLHIIICGDMYLSKAYIYHRR